MRALTGTILEVGPTSVRTLAPSRTSTSLRPEMITTALAGIDDTTVLFDERPVAVVALWQTIIAALVPPRHALTVVHPSWWPQRRVTRISEAAGPIVAEVVALPRAALFTAGEAAAAVVEITAEAVAVIVGQQPPTVLHRPANAAEIAQRVDVGGARILIDAPPEAGDLARGVRDALRRRGAWAELARIDDVAVHAPTTEPATVAASPRRSWTATVAAASVAAVVCVVGYAAVPAGHQAPGAVTDAVNLVEGRVTLRIPRDWEVTRVTAGPGSRRVQVSSPADRTAALQLTQSYAPGESLAATAAILRRAVADQPRGVFVDFNATDRRGERPAVTYREVRAGREIRWSIVLDGSTRISIGCQSAPGREDSVAQFCEDALRSARELVGTESGP
ncbi:type VII secretion-associated protein [Mycolicibacterium sp. CH28]|uniref:type VII secretion-associated protein n=1 Tax=Mycolicibacterium sp. CH28 TaxID=2512237 RepID=UPI001080E2A4|nr:type VII secretion-associated protein [Mycolicibacterium sp. CH28]TGD87259.1 type VII secretion-associated protein [Mycolicibacterium sp. CH28]